MVCFDAHYVNFDTIVQDPVTGAPLMRFIVYHEDGREAARLVLPRRDTSRWELIEAAQKALKEARRRRNVPSRLAG
jgi:hypothetical protein